MILVTGATGLSGAIVVQEFARQGHPVRALVRSRERATGLQALPGVEVVEGDMAVPASLGPALDGIERALMISSGVPDMMETQCSFIDSCKAAGVRHVVKFSGTEPNFNPQAFLFTRLHEAIEDYLEASGLAWTHLRPCQFMQVYLRERPSLTKDNALYLPAGDIRLAPIDIRDIAQVAVRLLRDGGHEGKSYDMTGPEALTMADIAARLSAVLGRPIRYVPVTPEWRRDHLIEMGAPRYFAEALYDQARERLRHPVPDLRLEAHAAFGVTPTVFADFARRHAAQFGMAAAPA
jgi:uncharacterized protein YbjT (DUF2867 family)